jgi:hypothetical protein
METANLGVVIFCPGWDFLGVRVTDSFGRVRSFFHPRDFNEECLRAALQSMRQRIESLKGELRTEADLRQFVDTRANDIILTPPRPMSVGSPQEELDALYEELLGRRRAGRRARPPAIPELDAIFRRPTLQGRVTFDLPVTIPVLGQTLAAPYAFRNGVLNLVRPEVLAGTPGAMMNRAERLAIEGDLLQKYPGEDGKDRKVIVVLKDAGEPAMAPLRDKVPALLHVYGIRLVTTAELGAFAREVEATAHSPAAPAPG